MRNYLNLAVYFEIKSNCPKIAENELFLIDLNFLEFIFELFHVSWLTKIENELNFSIISMKFKSNYLKIAENELQIM